MKASLFAAAMAGVACCVVACSVLTDLSGLAGGAGDTQGDGAADGGLLDAPADVTDATARHGYVFGAGGQFPANGTLADTTKTLFAPLLPDGTVGAWMGGPDLPAPTTRHGTIGVGGTVHVIGGYRAMQQNGTTNVTSSHLLDLGIFSPFAESAPLIQPTSDTIPVVLGTRAYVVTPGANVAQFATIIDGGFGGWTIQQGLDGGASTYYGELAATGNQLFWFGRESTAIVAAVGADGKLGDWRPIGPTPLLFNERAGAVATFEQNVYLLGGFHGDTSGLPTTDVYVATAANDGSLGPWRSVEPYPQLRQSYAAAAYGGFLYVLGGELNGASVKDVSYAKIRSDGSLEPWQPTTPLPNDHHNVVYGVVER